MYRTRNGNRNLWIGIGLLALVFLFAVPSFGAAARFDGYGFQPYGFAPFMWGIGMFFRLVIFGGIVFFIVRMFQRRAFRWDDADEPQPDELSPGEILKRRYAAGEITREQYEEIRQTLEGSTPA